MADPYAGTRLKAFVDLVETEMNDATVQFVIGKAKEGKHGKRRRLHWYREGGDVESASQQGGRVETGGDEATGTRAPTVWERQELISCGIFAESAASADTLLDNTIAAIGKTAGPSIRLLNYEWQENEIAQRVPLCFLRMSLILPVPEEQKALTEITATENTCEILSS